MLEILPQERWPELTDIFRREFNAGLPSPSATILAELDEQGKVDKFMVVEFVGRIGQIWQTGKKSREMFKFFDSQIPHGFSVCTIADTPRLERLCKLFGMRKEEGVAYRKDF